MPIARTPACLLAAFCGLALPAPDARGQDLRPGDPVECRDLAFFPRRWADRKLDTRLIPWEGKRVVLLTTAADLDRKTMARFVGRLDAGWALYADLTGGSPRPFKQLNTRPTVVAVPDAGLSCGYGCGYVGATGIEVAGFYAHDYPLVKKSPDAFPHYYFYEMGRNYYLWADRHSAFTTGYAVFMRYVCMDALKCDDPDAATRAVIEGCEAVYVNSKLPFLETFTNVGKAGEKGHRLTGRDGKPVVPSDQPVMYATAMLKLRKDHGGDAWVRRFLAALARCPEAKPDTVEGASRQCLNWLVAASAAAGKDLTPVFCDRWRMPLPKPVREALGKADWRQDGLDPAAVIRALPSGK